MYIVSSNFKRAIYIAVAMNFRRNAEWGHLWNISTKRPPKSSWGSIWKRHPDGAMQRQVAAVYFQRVSPQKIGTVPNDLGINIE